jgi:uncharacterized protein YeaO (DUF488 family)
MWLKDVAPSAALRKWFSHDVDRWGEFQRRYADELKKTDSWKAIAEASHGHKVTLIFGSKDVEHNNAIVLQKFLQNHSKHS